MTWTYFKLGLKNNSALSLFLIEFLRNVPIKLTNLLFDVAATAIVHMEEFLLSIENFASFLSICVFANNIVLSCGTRI